jgi:hypothetical protein
MPAKKKPGTKTDDREKVAVYLDNDQIGIMREIAETEKIPIAAQIRMGVDEFLKLKGWKKK